LFSVSGFSPNIPPDGCQVVEHTPGPDTRSSPEGLTGDGRKGGLNEWCQELVASAKIKRRKLRCKRYVKILMHLVL
jgi:hypothetical protein